MPTTVFCCGAECGMTTAGTAAGGVEHWDTASTGVAVDTNTFRAPGLRSYRFDSNGARSTLSRDLATPTLGVLRCYVRFGSLPTLDVGVAGFFDGATEFSVFYDVSTGSLRARDGATESATTVAVVVGTWYRIDLRVNVAANPRLTDWQVDGVAQTQLSRAIAATSFQSFRIGCGLSATVAVTGTVYVDDLAVSLTTGDYPLGAGSSVALVPVADGTHNFNAAGDFLYDNTTNVPTTATNTFGWVDDLLTATVTDFLAAAAVAAGEYLEWTLGSLPGSVGTINGLEVVSAHHAAGTAANKQSLNLIDGASTDTVFVDTDFSVTTITYNSKHLTAAPSTGAWTIAKVNAIKLRWAGSFTAVDISPVPFIDAIRLEVDFAPVPATPWQLTQALGCFTVDHQVRFGPFSPPSFGGSVSGFVRGMGLGGRLTASHRFMNGEDTDS